MKGGTVDRFWARVEKTATCWNWKGSTKSSGYGRFMAQTQQWQAHRYSLSLVGIMVPPGMVVDHTCRNRACVNPDHLRVVTPQVNSTENSTGITARNKAKTHCKRGHALVLDNIIQKKNGRACAECQKLHGRDYSKKHADRMKRYAESSRRITALREENESLRTKLLEADVERERLRADYRLEYQRADRLREERDAARAEVERLMTKHREHKEELAELHALRRGLQARGMINLEIKMPSADAQAELSALRAEIEVAICERDRLRNGLRNAAIRLGEIYSGAAHASKAGRWAALAWEALGPIPIGTEVDYWLGEREGLPTGRGKTRSQVEALGDQAVVWIEGVSGCVAITHVQPVRAGK